MMKFKYLGTAAAEGIPALFCACDVCKRALEAGGRNIRLRSCALINDGIMIDFTPDMLSNKIRFGLDLDKLKAIFFTHSHIDHLAAKELCYAHGMYSNRQDTSPKLKLYGNGLALQVIRQDFIFDMEHVPDCVELHPMEAFGREEIDGMSVTALPALHDLREQCLIYLIEQGDARMLYANDTTMLPEETFRHLKGRRLDVVSLDCTTGRHACAQAHMGFADNLAVKRRLLEIGAADEHTRFISHHFSHNGQLNYDDFEALAQGSGFVSSYDGMELVLGGGA